MESINKEKKRYITWINFYWIGFKNNDNFQRLFEKFELLQ